LMSRTVESDRPGVVVAWLRDKADKHVVVPIKIVWLIEVGVCS
jgi:hypothetical protein